MRKAMLVVFLATVTLLGNAAIAHATPPSNDDISNATIVTSLPYTNSVNTSEATYAATDTGCGAATVWYRYTPVVNEFIEVNTFGSDYDTTLTLHTGRPNRLTRVECNDDSVYGLQSKIVNEVTAGVTYYISAGTCCGAPPIGTVGPGGNLVVNIQPIPEPFIVTVTPDRNGTVTKNGLVTVTGTISCNEPAAYAVVNVTLSQRFNRNIAEGGSGTETQCGPVPSVWSIQFTSYTGTIFGSGNATANVSAYAYNFENEFDEMSPAQTVNLNRAK